MGHVLIGCVVEDAASFGAEVIKDVIGLFHPVAHLQSRHFIFQLCNKELGETNNGKSRFFLYVVMVAVFGR
ncbi:hypothetical protein DF182_25450 [Chitinophaga flava]|uniref:Uncharacterized protein n=1 Tax=Chitinophaga flava TaxID=2259036 RepID=A0A365XU00_9BACT|nr:hypothetical protein DF182_25450 [Chitinophaga flava]